MGGVLMCIGESSRELSPGQINPIGTDPAVWEDATLPHFAVSESDPAFDLILVMLERMNVHAIVLPRGTACGIETVAVFSAALDGGWVLDQAEKMEGLVPTWATNAKSAIAVNASRILRGKGMFQNIRSAVRVAQGEPPTRTRANTGTHRRVTGRGRASKWGSASVGCC